ncbi:choice-of-anchor J domain-containing protein [Myxococcota bacterium]|nr:choice-of-anchor J domain-containing protein [Myxococcota bacterium]
MKRTSLLFIMSLTFIVSLLSTGCDDGGKKSNNNNVNNTNNAVCGNSILETGETCDGTDLGTLTCETVEGDFTGGTLACTAGCALDTAGCTTGCTDACELDNLVCSGDTLRLCEANVETGCTEWTDTDCTLTSETCEVIGGVAQCAACTDACTLDDERCNDTDDGIEACVLGASGCTEWLDGGCPLPTPACELQAGVPTCVATCTDECTLDAVQCNLAADGIETCVNGAAGCTEWSNSPCDVATPECHDLAGVATCLAPNGSGESCADAYTIALPFYTEGTDFTADFTANDMTFTDASCTFSWGMSGMDAVFAVNLVTDETIIFAQGGGIDAGIYIQSVCDAAGVCLDKADDEVSNGTEGILFQAPADGTYYLIVKGFSASPSPATYAIAAYYYEDTTELTCDDGFDNDIDGLVDCEDSDCFGVGPCTTETVCDDGLDNDLDGDIDCADADCAGLAPCGPENTPEYCGDGLDNDNDGDTDCADADCAGIGPCGPENTDILCVDGIDNDNDGSTDCDDSDCAGFTACMPGQSCTLPLEITSFPFNVTGTNMTADFSNSNTFTYSAGGCGTANGSEGVYSVSLLAGQRIKLDETGALDAVIRVLGTCTDVTPTCLLSSDSVETNLIFTAPADGMYYVVLEAYSSTTTSGYNFTVNLIPDNESNCTDGLDNDLDTKIDCNDPDCFGVVGACETELNCGDGQDNDNDLDFDCDDIDCAAASACALGEGCANPEIVTVFPFNVTGTNFAADFANDHTFASATCTVTGGAEGVFAVDMLAGQRLRLNESGAMDAELRVLPACTTVAPTCLLNSDPETNVFFTAPSDGTYYVVLESYSSTTPITGYNFTIDLFDGTETSCIDGIDNDGNGALDCADPACFGTPTCPTIIFSENFNTWPLTGWTIVDGGSTTHTWTSSAVGIARTLNGATGTYAKVDSDAAGSGPTLDEQLISPAFDCTGYTTVTLSFRHYYFHTTGQTAVVSISTDGGTTWNPTPVVSYTASSANGAVANLDISAQAAGQANVAIRFHYTGSYDWYWLIDDVTVLGN